MYSLLASSLGSVMKVAALQSPLPTVGTADGLALIRQRVDQCEAEGVTILCCPEAVVGGLADYAPDPLQVAVPPPPFWRALARWPTRG